MTLDRTVTIERATVAVTGPGEPVSLWASLVTLRAEIVERAIEEAIGAAGARDTTSIVFRTRYVASITLADRIVFEGRPYNLRAVTPIGRNRGLELRASLVEP